MSGIRLDCNGGEHSSLRTAADASGSQMQSQLRPAQPQLLLHVMPRRRVIGQLAGSWPAGPQRRQPIGPGSAVAVAPLFRAPLARAVKNLARTSADFGMLPTDPPPQISAGQDGAPILQ
jgi:hypothetical protein